MARRRCRLPSSLASFWATLGLSCPRLSPATVTEAFVNPEDLWGERPEALAERLGVPLRDVEPLYSERAAQRGRALVEAVAAVGQELVSFSDERYPARLRRIADPPAFLCVQGALPPPDAPTVGIVGSREASPQGVSWARYFGQELGRLGVWVVSGGAVGIDAAAHEGALAAGGGTIAVRGSGLDIDYPSGHKLLYRDIAAAGASVSEHGPGVLPLRGHFPRRNRIIAGMSLGVIVVEAGARSGALVTARLAVDQGREVFAVPGALDSPLSVGTNRLIQQGAKLVMSVDDVLDELLPQLAASVPAPPRGGGEAAGGLLSAFDGGALTVDELAVALGRPAPSVAGELLELELSGQIVPMPGGLYRLGVWGRAR